MKLVKLYSFVPLLLLSLPVFSQVAADTEAPEEFVVVGRQPGPPMWRVYNGDNVLWIFPLLSPIPEDMVWESDKVAEVIAASQEVIGIPNVTATASPLLFLNPVNYVRGFRLMRRLARNGDGAALDDVLPPELYTRFAALQARYAPDDDDFEDMRPLVAIGNLRGLMLDEEGLDANPDTMKTLRRLLRRNRDIKHTDILVTIEIEGSFSSLADRAETFMENLDPALELECFEGQLRGLEHDLPDMKLRANAWAQGYAEDLRSLPLEADDTGPCLQLIMSSTEDDLLQRTRTDALWLDAAEAALAANASTFAILPVGEVLGPEGLFNRLKERGYRVREP